MRIERFRGALLSILVIASLITPLLLLSPSPVHALTPHIPIYIDGNAGFTKPDPVNGGGSGTENNPYVIENWNIDASSAHGIEIRNTTAYFIIRNCYVHNGRATEYYGIYLYNVKNGKIDNNIVENNFYGIYFDYRSDNNIIKNCIAENNEEDGIYLHYSFGNYIENCTTKSNNYCGIYLSFTSNNLIENCAADSNNSFGIYLYYSSNNHIENCTVKNNGDSYGYGIFLYPSSNNIIKNCIAENNHVGVELWGSSANVITNSTLLSNHYGIHIRRRDGPSDNNHIYHNNFVNNENQAYDECSNYWDDGYPSGGSYWSDYTGADIYRDEDQNLSGSDRIGDTPYYIPGDNNLDHYPLMNPFPLPWTGWARIRFPPPLRILIWPPPCLYPYTVSLETNLALYQGSKLVLKFYRYTDAYQGENVVWSGATPDNVSFSKIVPHPGGTWAENVRLDLTTDNTENVISTITSFTVRKGDLEIWFSEIPLWWALSPPEDRICIEIFFSELPLRWALAPS